MRRPKFKIWDTEENKWFKPTYRAYAGELEDLLISPSGELTMITLNHLHENVLTHESMFPNRFITVEWTGLTDRNGKEIYEGDIIRITFDTNFAEKPFYFGKVVYGSESGYPAFDLDPWIDCEMNALSWLKSESDESVISYEAIGNIYENPELIEVSA